jgi:3-methylcrotonyl-CoA carboxylase alpha subunit
VSAALFRKLLVANRGEIACRVLETCRKLGIPSVAVFSDADRNARHVRLADEAVHVGPAPARESYLRADAILAAAKATGADAIHPGYGFLSENDGFAQACAAAGVVFIGPPASAIRAMGSKSAAKTLMEQAGVALVPGYHGPEQDPEFLAQQAAAIGYPVLIKASAGGGGKGMRIVSTPDEFPKALESCKREASSSFGDDHLLVERYLQRPRHIEIQVFADQQGSCIHLFERDCSVQRRHQKVLEEAPAPGMDPERRASMGQAAIEAARAVGYVGAGTVEFIVDSDGAFFFMEMNTRLQVEHPVTEMITGIDLVEWQLRVAAGEPLPCAQADLSIRGHALEARIYAEDPSRGFLPSVGQLTHLVAPEASAHVRVDTGVEAGDAITPYYDPMIAKLIVWDENREAALRRLFGALCGYRIVGVKNNVEFLGRVAEHAGFAGGDFDTHFIERESDLLMPKDGEAPVDAWLAALLFRLLDERAAASADSQDPDSPWAVRSGWRLNSSLRRKFTAKCGGHERSIHATENGAGFFFELGDGSYEVSGSLAANGDLALEREGRRVSASVLPAGDELHVFLSGRCFVVTQLDPLAVAASSSDAHAGLSSPMPGQVLSLLVEPGRQVKKGTPLLVLEAMKMEHTITAPARGKVVRFLFEVGDQVPEGAELLEFEVRPGG